MALVPKPRMPMVLGAGRQMQAPAAAPPLAQKQSPQPGAQAPIGSALAPRQGALQAPMPAASPGTVGATMQPNARQNIQQRPLGPPDPAAALRQRFPRLPGGETGIQSPRQIPQRDMTPAPPPSNAGSGGGQWSRVRERRNAPEYIGSGQGGWEQTWHQPGTAKILDRLGVSSGTMVQQEVPGQNRAATTQTQPVNMQANQHMAQGIYTPSLQSQQEQPGLGSPGQQYTGYGTSSGSGGTPWQPPPQQLQTSSGTSAGTNAALGGAQAAIAAAMANKQGGQSQQGGVATGSAGLKVDPTQAGSPAEAATAQAATLAEGTPKDARGWDDYYDEAYGNRKDVPQEERDRVAGQDLRATFDEDVATDWGWQEHDDGTWTDSQGNLWRESAGVLTKIEMAANNPHAPGFLGKMNNDLDGDGKPDPQPGQGAGQGTPSEDWLRKLIEETSSGTVGQIDPAAVEAKKKAADEMYALKASQAMRAGLVGAARGGLSPEGQSGLLANVAQQAGAASANEQAQLGMQAELQNVKAQMAQHQNKLAALELAARFAQDKETQSLAMSEAAKARREMAQMQMLLGEYERRATAPGAGDYFLGGLGALSGLAGGTGSIVSG